MNAMRELMEIGVYAAIGLVVSLVIFTHGNAEVLANMVG
jgi:hypothetical protein